MTEHEETIALANKILERPNADPDDDLAMLSRQFLRALEEIERYKAWVADCQSGMYVNCVYCGHRYGPKDKVPVAMAEMLKQHVASCPKHPMAKLKHACLAAVGYFAGQSLLNEEQMRKTLVEAVKEFV